MSILDPEQIFTRLEYDQRADKTQQRKLETRKKIEWGGLVVKSKMHLHSKEIILGALLAAQEELLKHPESKDSFARIGKKAFEVFE